MNDARERLLACTLKRVRVKLPDWKIDLYVQEMDAGQRVEYYDILTNAVTDKTQKSGIAAKILLPSLLNLDGSRLLADDDLGKLESLSPQVITKLTNSLLEVSGLIPDWYEAEKKRLKPKSTSFFSRLRGRRAKA